MVWWLLDQCFHLGFCNNSSFELYRIKLFKFFNFIGKKFSSFELYRIKLFKFLNFIGKKFSHVFTSIPLNTSNIHSNHMCSFKIQFSCNSSSQNMHLFCLHGWSLKNLLFLSKWYSTIHIYFIVPLFDTLLITVCSLSSISFLDISIIFFLKLNNANIFPVSS